MKILIAYTSKNGTVRTCVERLCTSLNGLDVTAADLNMSTPNVADYDMVILGGAVHFGKWMPAMRDFIKDQYDALMQTKLGLFLCSGLAHEQEYYIEKLFSKELRDHAFQTLYFGGSLRKDGLPFFDKLVVRHLRSIIIESEIDDGEYTPSMPGILPENIEKMGTYARKELFREKE